MMALTCRECGATIDADDVNLDRMVAKCRQCDAVFGIDGMVESTVKPMDVPLPERFQLEPTIDGLRIRWRWFAWVHIFIAIFAIFWNGFVFSWMGITLFTEMWGFSLFGTIHLLVGLGLAYFALTGFINSTTIDVNAMEIRVKNGPLPWPGKELASPTIAQLYTKERISRGRRSTSVSYEVHAVTGEGRHEKLLGGLHDTEQALFLEQEIERYLGLKDRPVRGEYGR
jgi:hypothetical protein